ncbi:MAG: 16S rRNA (uracil(1498)-N(3))-methyltransferase [Burkholderiales bacterium]
MTRIYVNLPLATGATLTLPQDAARHLLQVLRFKAGEKFVLFNGTGGEYEAQLHTVTRRKTTAHVVLLRDVERESPLSITLAQCVAKGERMDYTLQKAVELGVAAIQPLLSARSVVRLADARWEKKLEHWRGVIIAACEQSGRTRLPTIAAVTSLAEWLAVSSEAVLKLALSPDAAVSLTALAPLPNPLPQGQRGHVVVLVGPEGGLSQDELACAQRAGFTGLRLGPRVLRTETAGVAALAVIQAIWGDLN